MWLRLTPKFGQPSYWNTDRFLIIHVTGSDTGSTTVELSKDEAITFEETIRINLEGRPYIYDHELHLRNEEARQKAYQQHLAQLGMRSTTLSDLVKVHTDAEVLAKQPEFKQPVSKLGRLFGQG